MEQVFPMAALRRNPAEVERAAKDGIVRVTGQGAAAYVFCSEERFAERIAREHDD